MRAKFFETVRGGIYPISRVLSVAKDKKDGPHNPTTYTVRMTEENEVSIWDTEYEAVFASPILTIIAAAPGYMLLHYFPACAADEDDCVGRSPLIAWGFCADGLPIPITASGPHDGVPRQQDEQAILHPGGTVTAGGDSFDAEEHWLGEKRHEAKVLAVVPVAK